MEFVAEQATVQEEVKNIESETVVVDVAQDSNPESKPADSASSDDSDNAEEPVKLDHLRIDDQSEEERQKRKASERVRFLQS